MISKKVILKNKNKVYIAIISKKSNLLVFAKTNSKRVHIAMFNK